MSGRFGRHQWDQRPKDPKWTRMGSARMRRRALDLPESNSLPARVPPSFVYNMSICSKAVRLPEIVATILNTIDDKKTLVSCIQVNRPWAEEATACLWRSDPPIDALLALNRPDRLQYYANKIVTLGTFISEPFTPCSEYN